MRDDHQGVRPYSELDGIQRLGDVWTLERDAARLVVELRTHPLGWELRQYRDGAFLKSQVAKSQTEFLDLADAWKREALARGWTDPNA